MLVVTLPMLFAYTVLGFTIGVAVGRKVWGRTDAVLLGVVLGAAPAVSAYVLFAVAILYAEAHPHPVQLPGAPSPRHGVAAPDVGR